MGGSKTTTSNTVDPKLMALYQQNYQTAQGVANRPYQPYTGEGVAGFTPAQTQAQGILSNIGTGNIGDDALNGAVGGAQSVLGSVGANAPSLKGTDLSPYMNPYQSNVIDATLARLDQQRGQQRVADDQAATQANAFGGNRQGVADALTNQQYDMDTANILANLQAQNFGQAQNAAEFDLNHALQNNQLGLTASDDLANMSAQQLNQATQKASLLDSVGSQQQQQQQNADNWNYQQYLNQWNYPVQQQDIRNAALGMIPLQQTQTQKTSQSGIGGILGPLAQVGSAAFISSDARVKENVSTAGFDSKGRRWVDFNYIGDDPRNRMRGVIAQEVARTDPHAVRIGRGGILNVDYSQLR